VKIKKTKALRKIIEKICKGESFYRVEDKFKNILVNILDKVL